MSGTLARPMVVLFVIALANGGCAITNYDTIVDNDQVSNGQGSGIVNTNGKAMIFTKPFVTIYPDGVDQTFTMVDQKSNGDRTLTTYNNFSTLDEPWILDNFYCNPDWQGCAIFTAPDPETNDIDLFDGVLNENCNGARSLSLSLSTGRYDGECGRARIPLRDRIAIANMGRVDRYGGREALLFDLGHRNTRITLDNNAGIVTDVRLSGRSTLAIAVHAPVGAVIDVSHPLLDGVADQVAEFLDRSGTSRTTVTVTYNGIASSWEVGGDLFRGSRIREIARRRF